MRNRGLQTLNFISTRFKIGNPGIFYDPYSFRFTSRRSGASTRKRTVPPHQGSIFIATFSIYKFGKPEEGWYGQPKLRVVLISKIEKFDWLSQSWSEQRVLFFTLFFLSFFWPWGGGGGGARRFHPGGFIFSWLQVSIKGIPQYMKGREFRRLGFFKDLWLIFSEMHIMAVSFLFFLLDKKTSNQE